MPETKQCFDGSFASIMVPSVGLFHLVISQELRADLEVLRFGESQERDSVFQTGLS